jgi:hypothetical protein
VQHKNGVTYFATERVRCQLFDWNQRASWAIKIMRAHAMLTQINTSVAPAMGNDVARDAAHRNFEN